MTYILAHLRYGSNAECQQHHVLHCQTILQCIMLKAGVRKGFGQMRTPEVRGEENGSFLQTSVMDDT